MDNQIALKLAGLEEEEVLALVRQELEAGTDPVAIFDACREGMVLVGERFEDKEYYISDLMMAGEIFRRAAEILGPELKGDSTESKGVVVIGTVKGDIHNIGKDLVVGLLEAAGYEVRDLGVDVPVERFVEALNETGATVVGLSGLLTIAFDAMKATVAALDEAGLRPKVRVMIGGGPTTEGVREYTGADAWGANAQAAVNLCNQWMEG
jgi:methanogenic corrinoid protein MtbC1